jgi:hypothetical protein
MKTKLLVLFIFSPLFIFSQIKITGKVLDKETQEPVSNVIIHTDGGISVTDDAGQYVFEVNQSAPVYFRHLAYDLVTIQSDSLRNNSTIHLIPSVIELNEVVISPNRVEDLLNKAVRNLFTNFQKEKTTTHYLYHIEETTTIGGDRDIYALIEATLSKIRVKKKSCSWDWNFKLTQLDKVNNLNDSSFYIKGKFFGIQLFPQKLTLPSDVKNVGCELYEDNNDKIIIKMSSQLGYFLITINKQDTILTGIIGQSYSNSTELTTKKSKSVTRQTSNHFSKYEFVKDISGLYHLDKFQHFISYKILSDTPYELTFKISTHAVQNISANVKKKRIRPYDFYLYKSKFPDSPGFWKQYLNQ